MRLLKIHHKCVYGSRHYREQPAFEVLQISTINAHIKCTFTAKKRDLAPRGESTKNARENLAFSGAKFGVVISLSQAMQYALIMILECA